MEASASPRKPRVWMSFRSSSAAILLVAWHSEIARDVFRFDAGAVVADLDQLDAPPDSMETVIWVAPASMEFSISSLTTEAGRSTTSPAAISSAVCLSRTRMDCHMDILLSCREHTQPPRDCP